MKNKSRQLKSSTAISFSLCYGAARPQVPGKIYPINPVIFTAIFLDEQGSVVRTGSSDDSSYRMQIRITAGDFQAEAGAIVRRKFDARIAVHATPTLSSMPEEESPEASEARRESPVDEPAEGPGAG